MRISKKNKDVLEISSELPQKYFIDDQLTANQYAHDSMYNIYYVRYIVHTKVKKCIER
jgi:hypothetical protein